MVNNTVNGKKIGSAAGKDDKLKFNYFSCGKKNEKEKIEADLSNAKSDYEILKSKYTSIKDEMDIY